MRPEALAPEAPMVVSYVDGPRGQEFSCDLTKFGRVQSYVRPIGAVRRSAGPDEVRGSDPNQNRALEALDEVLPRIRVIRLESSP